MNTLKLKGRIAEKGMTISQLADKLGITLGTLSRKMSGESDFKRGEVLKIQELLSLNWEETREIFFCS